MLPGDNLLERADGLLQGDELALETSEDLRDLEGLRHETLDLTRALDLEGVLVYGVVADEVKHVQ